MKTKYVKEINVTPEMAKLWLSKNIIKNRNISKKRVSKYANEMKLGRWYPGSTQSIVLNDKGELMDGQHRLTALIKANMSIIMNVWFNADEAEFMHIDTGMARNVATSTGIPRRFTSLYNCMLNIAIDSSSHSAFDIVKLDSYFHELTDEFLIYCPKVTQYFSSSPVKVAAVATIVTQGNKKHVFNIYKSVVTGRIKNASPIAEAFNIHHLNGFPSHTKGYADIEKEIFVAASYAFDIKNKDVTDLQIKSTYEEKYLVPFRNLIKNILASANEIKFNDLEKSIMSFNQNERIIKGYDKVALELKAARIDAESSRLSMQAVD